MKMNFFIKKSEIKRMIKQIESESDSKIETLREIRSLARYMRESTKEHLRYIHGYCGDYFIKNRQQIWRDNSREKRKGRKAK